MSVVVRGPARMLELATWLAEDGVAPGGLPVLRAKNLFALPRNAVPPSCRLILCCHKGSALSLLLYLMCWVFLWHQLMCH